MSPEMWTKGGSHNNSQLQSLHPAHAKIKSFNPEPARASASAIAMVTTWTWILNFTNTCHACTAPKVLVEAVHKHTQEACKNRAGAMQCPHSDCSQRIGTRSYDKTQLVAHLINDHKVSLQKVISGFHHKFVLAPDPRAGFNKQLSWSFLLQLDKEYVYLEPKVHKLRSPSTGHGEWFLSFPILHLFRKQSDTQLRQTTTLPPANSFIQPLHHQPSNTWDSFVFDNRVACLSITVSAAAWLCGLHKDDIATDQNIKFSVSLKEVCAWGSDFGRNSD